MRDRGHHVTLATNDHFEPLIRAAGVEFVSTSKGEEYLETLKDPELWHRTRGFKAVFQKGVLPLVQPIYQLIAERYVPGKTVVVAHAIALGARIAQEKLGVPLATVHLAPAVLRSRTAPPLLPGGEVLQYLPKWLIPEFWRFADRFILDPVIAPPLNAFRATLALPPARSIIGDWWMSPQRVIGLFPEWFAPPQQDWPPQLKLTGFPLFDEGGQQQLSPELEAFLAAGSLPIAFTFGSAMLHAEDLFRESVKACKQLGRRGLLLTRYPEQLPSDLPAEVLHVPYAPFSALLPKVAALVHHGGIGTTSQALAAGIPQLVCHLSHDQPDNAQRLKRLGVGDEISARKYRAARLAKQLKTLLDNASTQARCREVAAKFENADTLGATCAIIELLNQTQQQKIQ